MMTSSTKTKPSSTSAGVYWRSTTFWMKLPATTDDTTASASAHVNDSTSTMHRNRDMRLHGDRNVSRIIRHNLDQNTIPIESSLALLFRFTTSSRSSRTSCALLSFAPSARPPASRRSSRSDPIAPMRGAQLRPLA